MPPFEPLPLPPAELDYVRLLPLIGKANRAVAALEGTYYGLLNPNVVLSPITTQEAVLSSKIEGTQANLEDVLKFEAGEEPAGEERRHDIYEIINYRKALRVSEQLLKEKPFCLNTLLRLHQELMDSVRGFDKSRGKFRTIQNWIGKANTPIEQAAFIPPSPLRLQEHLNQWEAYWHSDAPDVFVQLALIHAQFEIIHPFLDGNGRIGRMIIPLFLFEKKILSQPCFYLSEYLEANRDTYIEHLRTLGSPGSWHAWVTFFLNAVAVQAEANAAKARSIQDLYERLKREVLTATHSQFGMVVLDFMFQRPIFRSSDLNEVPDMPSVPVILSILSKLKSKGILTVVRQGAGRRAQVLALAELLNLCEGKKVF